MKQRLIPGILLSLILNFYAGPVIGTTGSGISGGAFMSGVTDGSGTREWVDLVERGGLLIGSPKKTSIRMIMVDAPGSREGSLLIRENTSSEGMKSILITAPDDLHNKTRRAIIYLREPSKDLVMLEKMGDTWKRLRPQKVLVTLDDRHKDSQETLQAFSIRKFGLYWLKDKHSQNLSASAITSMGFPKNSLQADDFIRGVGPLVWAVSLLAFCSAISFLIHKAK